jgi:NAD(P)H-dependent FMN reductase
MKITVINGTNRIGNKTMNISQEAISIVSDLGYDSSLVNLTNFTDLFRGEYLSLNNANAAQKKDIQDMIDADVLLFVVPTYHRGIPAPLKNFLDILDEDSAFDNKVIGIIASNKSQSFGADQAAQVINGILSFGKLNSFVVPRINITDHSNINTERLEGFMEYVISFAKKQSKGFGEMTDFYLGTC